ncbi:hypothetical protein EDD85DRAFT_857528 [Armillaria nabsnona]|nr:hypothetical protein EDD85DRAFT_857528 [Armillaria nabsnona]
MHVGPERAQEGMGTLYVTKRYFGKKTCYILYHPQLEELRLREGSDAGMGERQEKCLSIRLPRSLCGQSQSCLKNSCGDRSKGGRGRRRRRRPVFAAPLTNLAYSFRTRAGCRSRTLKVKGYYENMVLTGYAYRGRGKNLNRPSYSSLLYSPSCLSAAIPSASLAILRLSSKLARRRKKSVDVGAAGHDLGHSYAIRHAWFWESVKTIERSVNRG